MGVLEGRGRGDADEQHGHADVDEVAAVAAAVAAHQRHDGARRGLAAHRAPGLGAAPELLQATATAKAAMANIASAVGAAADAGGDEHDEGHDAGGDGQREVAPGVGPRRAPPGDHRPDARQQDEHERERHGVAVEPRRPDGRLLARDGLGDQREERAPEDDEGQADEHDVVAQEDGLARQQRVEAVLGAQRVAAADDQPTEPTTMIPMRVTNGTPSVEAPNAWIESRTPERTRNVPRMHERARRQDQRRVPRPSASRASPGS